MMPVTRCAAPARPSCSGTPRSTRAVGSDGAHVGGSRALGALLLVVLDLRALGERFEAAAGDRGVVHEQVVALVVGRDEAKALVVAEPLHGSSGHRCISYRGVSVPAA